MAIYFASLQASPIKVIAAVFIFGSIFLFFINFIYLKFISRRDTGADDAFWEREAEANFVRKKPLDDLPYIKLPDDLPLSTALDDPDVKSYVDTILYLKEKRILNLQGYTNTDLKFMYGAGNLETVSLYDSNFEDITLALQGLADKLLSLNHEEEAVKIMEYLVSIDADLLHSYKYLGERYLSLMEYEKFDELLFKAENLRTGSKKLILKSLDELKDLA
ncbi:MAG: hypothetical protein J6U37_04605 [Lachnospiraceae bacterium]|nr:hypothetical protein [Lachnospiraceae bacterium]